MSYSIRIQDCFSFFFNFGPLDGHTVFHDYETVCLPLMLLRLVSVFSV